MSKNPIEREMRRKDRLLSKDEAMRILSEATHGVLSCIAQDGWPYGTPLSHVLIGEAIYFHCAQEGLRNDILLESPKVCYTAVTDDNPMLKGEANFTTEFASVIAFGKASPVTDEKEKQDALMKLCERFLPQHMDKAPLSIGKSAAHTAVWRIDIESVTAKSNK